MFTNQMTKKNNLSDSEYKYVFSRVPRLCVDLIIRYNHGFILSKRSIPPSQGTWHFPGGRVLYKESIKEAASRIAEKEIGLKIKISELLGYMEFPNDGEFVHSVSLVFLAEVISGKIRGSEQAEEIRIFTKIPTSTHEEQRQFLTKNWTHIQQKLNSI